MTYEVQDMTGSIFEEKSKRNEKAPDWRGTVKIGGRTLEIAGWARTTRNGDPWLSLKFSEPRQRQDAPKETREEINERVGRRVQLGLDDDEVPFSPETRA